MTPEQAFEMGLTKCLEFEGGWGNHPNDSGGETYRGVARNYHPGWPGWQIVDRIRQAVKTPGVFLDRALAQDAKLQEMVRDFYRLEFWIPCKAQAIAEMDAGRLAAKHFDFSVNTGCAGAGRVLQEALNSYGLGLAVDGVAGPKTLGAVDRCLHLVGESDLLAWYARRQREYYEGIIARNPTQEVFRAGWTRRAAWIPPEVR